MGRVPPRPRSELAEFEESIARSEAQNGFVPNVQLTLSWRPEILRAMAPVYQAIMREGEVDPGLKLMVSHVVSVSAGCPYTQAHTAEATAKAGVEIEKVEALSTFETSELFDDRERAALRLARDAGRFPNAVTGEHFEALREFFTESQIVELLAVASWFGFYNRFHSTNITSLEDVPFAFSSAHLAPARWAPGKHRP